MSDVLHPKSSTPSIPANETARLAALHRYKILDTPPEAAFDRITRLTARLFQMPIALISLVDESRAWFKSCVGFGASEVPRDDSLCNFAVLTDEPLIVPDARQDDRFACNPFVQRESGVRFYAGAPLLTQDGFNLGTLCLLDTQPHSPFTPEQEATLVDLAAMVVDELELRLASQQTAQSEAKYRTLFESIDEGFCICEVLFDPNGKPYDYRFLEVNPIFAQLTGLENAVGKTARELVPNLESDWIEIYGKVVQTGEPVRFEQQSVAMSRWFDVNAFCIGEPQNHQIGILFTNITDRKLAEEQRERFFALGSDLQVITGNNGYFQWVSPSFERILGWTQTEMTTRPWTEFVHPADVPASIAETASLFSGNETYRFENRYRHKDGSYHWFLWNAQPDSEKQVLYGAAIDITDRIRAEEDRDRFFQLSRDMLAIANMDGYFLQTNSAWTETLGYTIQDLMAQPYIELVHPDDQAATIAEAQKLAQGIPTKEFENRYRHQDGSYRWLSWSVAPFVEQNLLYAVARDVTDRKRTEAALRDSEAESRNILASIGDGFIALDENWRFVYVNQDAERLLNYSATQLMGQIFWEVFPGVNGTELEQLHRQVMRDRVADSLTTFYPDHDRWYEVRSYPAAKGITIYFRDVSELMQLEQERDRLLQQEQAAREAAEKANRIKDEFLAVLSHELRTPLNPILGWTKILLSGRLDSAKRKTALETIERNAKLQAQLIEDLLDISRILRGKLTLDVFPVLLVTPIRAAVETVRFSAEAKHIQIQTILDPNVPAVLGDAARLQQVVWNLLTNAIKFTPDGGQVTVKLESYEFSVLSSQLENQTQNSKLKTQNSYAQITVSDTGKGIKPEFLPHLFEHFRQEDGSTTRKFGGLGLGLAIVRQIVELHGGTVQAESQGEGLGATFTVRLPLHSREAEAMGRWTDRASSTLPPAAPAPLPLTGLHILVVDDEADSRDFISFVVEQAGARVTIAATAVEAITQLMQTQFDLLLSDIGMPGMDGYALMRQVRSLPPEQNGQVKAIALTAYAGEANYQQAMAAGYQQHISKPIEPDLLVREVTKLLNTRVEQKTT